jgi:LytR cell envelope-related transcriptional attenuator
MRERWNAVWPSLVALLGTVAVVGGLLLFFGRDIDSTDDPVAVGTDTASGPAAEPTATETPPPDVKAPIRILNAAGVSGLAARTADTLRTDGWEVTGADNFSGEIAATTIFAPAGLEAAAATLSRTYPVLAVVEPAREGMGTTELTLVLAQDVTLAKG